MNISCGILLHHGGKYLLGHCTNKPDKDGWTIPKGLKEENETFEQAAYREFKEETNIDLKALGLYIMPHTEYKLGKKLVKVFYCEDVDGITLAIRPVCYSMVMPGNFPEIDGFRWMTKHIAHQYVFPSQKFLFR